MRIIKKNSEKGFALPLALLLLVVMTIMGATLVNITSTEHNANTNKDSNQQTFYAAESGISVAKNWMVKNISKFTIDEKIKKAEEAKKTPDKKKK